MSRIRSRAEIAEKHEERVRQIGKREDAALRRPERRANVAPAQGVVAEALGPRRAFQRQRKGGWERAVLAKALVERAGLTQREAARGEGLTSGAAVSIQFEAIAEGPATGCALEKPPEESNPCWQI